MDILDATLRLQELARRINDDLLPFATQEGLTLITAHALWNVDPDRTDLTMSELAAHLRCNASNITFIVKQLESRGFAERSSDPADGRRTVVGLTDEGASARQRLGQALASVSPLTKLTQEEGASFARILNVLRG
ncbi:MarR family transcriptional regulator [Rhodococcus sp. BP-349]|uniref:MarR family winged helix-turn-helix transcriptional regulator n=1 Tax=unclassified Rhodococcus (in: high G+C Gram-positive bacteria) TaxID=192944 RepID=UPI001C9BB740|nr:MULTISPECIES: MarR family transcriptional regulator [unclassified Rhodococcus (in: high G+C Gram-positive bacteria)]MBY6537850.1 MarR family transcriptional regulator [Rhodococcus sp. BP-363]MBY6542187.1 MarR family transcriptional regulator [Rhodococcus sp. BP-369]MBY6561417.1 MarR family transcriptional regulator [Rhodococcus sp. BP-370]MBY6575709.1 MarR family transcriptional regulator [Rhodococcus sp. BP-364]MBY6585010.1 MarR family transcriptional regulator [Rhodococcus sp. BP-358]